jgi:hypothetical protein
VSVAIIAEKSQLGGKTHGSALIGDVELSVDPNAAVPDLGVEQKQLGNVFNSTEKVEVGVRTKADRVRWVATDFWQNKVGEGKVDVADNRAMISPGANLRGWFMLDLVAEKVGAEKAGAEIARARRTARSTCG